MADVARVVRVAPPPAAAGAEPAPAVDARADRTLRWLGLTASTVGLCLLLFVGYLFGFTGFQAARHQRALLGELYAPGGALSGRVPADGQPAGVLDVPALHLRQVVVQGTTATDLLEGPGLMPGTARPGTAGNAVIAGRRTAGGRPFADLGRLARGDRITVTTGLGRFEYRVVRVATAADGSVDPVAATRRARLTLVTSNPPLVPTGLLYAVADLVTTPAKGTVPRQAPTVAERGLAGDPGAVLPSVLWGLALVGCLAATIWAYLRWQDKVWTVYLLSTPLVLAVALVWYESLVRLLPATM
jgi:LPXTG-site transpeptidase (sortase) family protein